MTLNEVSDFIRCASNEQLRSLRNAIIGREQELGRLNMSRMRYGATVKVSAKNCEFTGTVTEIKQKKITVRVTEANYGRFNVGGLVVVPASLATILS